MLSSSSSQLFVKQAATNYLLALSEQASTFMIGRACSSFTTIDLSKVRPSGTANNVYALLAWKNDSIYAGTFGPLTAINTHDYGLEGDPFARLG